MDQWSWWQTEGEAVCLHQSSQCFPQIWILFVRWVGWLWTFLNNQIRQLIGSKESIQVQGKIVSWKMSLVHERIQKGSRWDELGSNQMWIVPIPPCKCVLIWTWLVDLLRSLWYIWDRSCLESLCYLGEPCWYVEWHMFIHVMMCFRSFCGVTNAM